MQVSTADVLVLGALVFAIAFVIVRALTMRPIGFKLSDRMGPATWDFTDSWASTLTAVGALLGTILGAGVLPEETQRLSNAAFAGLNLLFGVLIVLAAFVYNATRQPTKKNGKEEVQYQGYVWSFLLASAMTLWAVLGELATMFLLLAEIQAEGSMSAPPILVFQSVLAAAGVVLIVYAWRTIYWTVESQHVNLMAEQELLFERLRDRGVKVEQIKKEQLEPPGLPKWSML